MLETAKFTFFAILAETEVPRGGVGMQESYMHERHRMISLA